MITIMLKAGINSMASYAIGRNLWIFAPGDPRTLAFVGPIQKEELANLCDHDLEDEEVED